LLSGFRRVRIQPCHFRAPRTIFLPKDSLLQISGNFVISGIITVKSFKSASFYLKFPVNGLSAGILAAETSSHWTAYTTTASYVCGNFPAAGEKPQMAACAANVWSLAPGIWIWGAVWAPYSLGLEFPFPGNRDCSSQRPVRLACFGRRKAKSMAPKTRSRYEDVHRSRPARPPRQGWSCAAP
jgi:hypothetical protein